MRDAVGQSTCFNKMDIDGEIKKEVKVIAERQVELLVGAAILKVRMSHMHVITSTQGFIVRKNRSRKDKNDKYIHINFCCCEKGNKQEIYRKEGKNQCATRKGH